MNRRNLLRGFGAAGLGIVLPAAPCRIWASTSPANRFLYINIQASGGWDVASFCDPKVNQPNEKIINNWAQELGIEKAGNISYAPVGNNAKFFKQHFDKMLVINGINCKTNAHGAGKLFNHSGSQKNGVPYLSALHAQAKNQGLAMPLLVYGDASTASLIAPTKISRSTFDIVEPNLRTTGQAAQWLPNDDYALIKSLQASRAQKIKNSGLQLTKQQMQMDDYYDAVFANTEGFKNFSALYLALNEGELTKDNYTDALKFALTAMATGLGVSTDITLNGFDTHDNHDTRGVEALNNLTNAVNMLWYYAEQLGISDRIVVSIASDFARTPHYNDGKGKDHWPYGSTILMQKNATWTNRVVGKTNELQKGLKINPSTLQLDVNGVELEPTHIHQNLRSYLGVTESTAAQKFSLSAATPVDLLITTAQTV